MKLWVFKFYLLISFNCDDIKDMMKQTVCKKSRRNQCIVILLIGILINCVTYVDGQALPVTRDPRYYNREGNFNFNWPNPGDPDYRYLWIITVNRSINVKLKFNFFILERILTIIDDTVTISQMDMVNNIQDKINLDSIHQIFH